jgi:hypothetical protein
MKQKIKPSVKKQPSKLAQHLLKQVSGGGGSTFVRAEWTRTS